MEATVDDFVSAVVVARLSRPDARDLLADPSRVDLDALRTEAQALRLRLGALAVDFADGSLTKAQGKTATARVQTKLADVESQMADAGRASALGPLVSARDVQAAWDALTVSQRRLVIDTLMVVTLHPVGRGTRTFRPETVEVTWKAS